MSFTYTIPVHFSICYTRNVHVHVYICTCRLREPGLGGGSPLPPPVTFGQILADLELPTFCPKFRGPKKNPKNRPPFHIFWDPTNPQKIDPRRIFRGLGRGPKKGPPSRGAKSEILQLFTRFELGPRCEKGTPFRDHFGEAFSPKKRKKGVPKKDSKNDRFLKLFGDPQNPQKSTTTSTKDAQVPTC